MEQKQLPRAYSPLPLYLPGYPSFFQAPSWSQLRDAISKHMSYYLALLNRQDLPIYELEFGSSRQGGDGIPHFDKAVRELVPFVVHAALDVVDDMQWTSPAMYLKTVDNFYSYMISAYVTAGNVRFMLVHETKNEEAIRQFFLDVYDLYVKTLMSPFYKVTDRIQSPAFDAKVRTLAKKYL